MLSIDLYAYASARDHVIHVIQAAAALETTPAAVKRVLTRDGWSQPFYGVALPPGAPLDPVHLARAAMVAVGGPVAVTRWTALHLLGIQRTPPSRVQLLVPGDRHLRSRAGIEIARSRLWLPTDVVDHRSVAVLSGDRLLLDLAAIADLGALRAIAIDLRFAGYLDLQRLHARLDATGPLTNIAAVREVVHSLLEAGRTDSPIELEVREAAADRGIHFDPGQLTVSLVGGGTTDVDLGIAALRLGVKIHGFGFHSSPAQLDRDATRDTEIAKVADDWRILVVTWSRWQRDREGVLDDLVQIANHQRTTYGTWAAA